MKKRIHLTKTEIALLLLTILFAVSMLLYKVSRVQKGDWQITTEREDRQQQEIVPVNINTATEEELIAVEASDLPWLGASSPTGRRTDPFRPSMSWIMSRVLAQA